MNKLAIVTGILTLLSLQFAFGQASLTDAREVMAKNEEARKLSDVTSEATLTVVGANGEKRAKGFTWWRKLSTDQVRYKTLTRFNSPAEIRDEAILFVETNNGQADVLIYLPAFKKTRRIESMAQNGGFMSSEFSYADIATPHMDDFTHKLLKSENCPDGGSCYVVESTPKTEDVRERLGYNKQVSWVRADNFMIVKGEFYNLEGKLTKRLTATDVKEVDPAKKRFMPHRLEMENVDTKKKTVMEFKNVRVNQNLPDSKFSPQNISRK